MKVNILTKKMALLEAENIKKLAFKMAESFKTLPGYCDEFICKRYCDLISLSQLPDDAFCVFINDLAANEITDFEITNNNYVIGKICAFNLIDAFIADDKLCLKYNDGVLEYFKFRHDIDCWQFEINSLGTKIKPEHGIFN